MGTDDKRVMRGGASHHPDEVGLAPIGDKTMTNCPSTWSERSRAKEQHHAVDGKDRKDKEGEQSWQSLPE